MKKIKLGILSFICMFILPVSVFAASAKINITSSSTVVVGNYVVVTVKLSAGASWEMNLNYDKNYLKLEGDGGEAGGTKMVNTSVNKKDRTYKFTFKTLKKGNTTVKVGSYYIVDDDFKEMDVSSGAKSINIITQAELEASYSKNNNLKSLSIEGFELDFKKDTLEYNVVVPEDTKSINIKGAVEDNRSSVSGLGTHEVNQGTNKFEIVVRAQNGGEKTYTINVEVKDSNPINVVVDGNNYTVVKLKENLPSVNLYSDATIKINDFDIPAYKNDYTKLILVGLKNESGDIQLFIYDEEKNEYKKYQEIGSSMITIYPIKTNKEVMGYKKEDIVINEVNLEGYVYNKSSNFLVIYGVNVENGDEGFYMYDKVSQSITKYNDEYIVDLNKKIENYTYIIFGFIGLLVLMLIIIIVLAKRKKRKTKVNIKENIKEEKVENKKNKITEIE